MEVVSYEFDAAFSFLHEDEKIAYEINDFIHDRFKTFIYSKSQDEIVGTDGELFFHDVFGKRARIVVVLFRENWGKTPWTRIEETAIRNRAHEKGYDFSLFVQLDKNSQLPSWLPKTRIYFDFSRWGSKGLAPVIESKIQEFGGSSRVETLDEQKARIKRQLLALDEKKKYFQSRDAIDDAKNEYSRLHAMFEKKIKELEDPEMNLRFSYEKRPTGDFSISNSKIGLHFSYQIEYINKIEDARLHIVISSFVQTLHKISYKYDFYPITGAKGWTLTNDNESIVSSEDLLEKCLKVYLDFILNKRLSE